MLHIDMFLYYILLLKTNKYFERALFIRFNKILNVFITNLRNKSIVIK